MPRLPRIHVEGAIYYVTSKASETATIFKDKADYKMYLDLLTKYKSQHKFKLFAYSLQPDRLTLLIETSGASSISLIMHDLNSLYTKYYNGRYSRRGPLFESRFRSVLVEKAGYLLEMTRLIHDMPSEQSSAPVYLYKEAQPGSNGLPDLSEEMAEVKSFLKEKDDPQAYERYCAAGSADELAVLEKRLRRGSVLGGEEFAEAAKRRVEAVAEELKEEARLKARPARAVVFMVGFLVLVATASSVYLYVSKEKLNSEYTALLKEKEAEFAEKTRFENRSPIALTELEGTEWEIEMVPLPADEASGTVKDKIRFVRGRLQSKYFGARGFGEAPITVQPGPNGVALWSAVQLNLNGEKVTWRGNWQGDNMKGVASLLSPGNPPRNFSFFERGWDFVKGGAR
ncbi:MAG TPA: transposase [Candidatus Eisenbacteria bacterium]|nr:transposase [Candidatus Eisenbacteria bacterium]